VREVRKGLEHADRLVAPWAYAIGILAPWGRVGSCGLETALSAEWTYFKVRIL